mmetsp:Transcript_40754/g.73487  ORF Transcript_40754/g.73487 Transcript_40754/m.73487 type:complete len:100 (-) Transcript_40754:24-323(-)
MTSFVNVSAEVTSSTGDNVTQEGKLSNTAVLDLNITETVESLLVGLVEESEGIEEAKRSLDTELTLEGSECGGDLASGGRGKGSGGGSKGGEDGKFHHG